MALILVQVGPGPARAQADAIPPAPPQVQELLRLLEDPDTRAWIDRQARPAPSSAGETAQQPQDMNSELMATRVEALRTHLASLAAAVPRLPQEARQAADRLSQELQNRSALDV